ncbi:MAG: hypothetical protein HOA17_01320 [Candidatus Melainabacteria bacterium]|jgi:hypothetical protein|nr:hypothetical protein [Candidatus Melainabacteria bacterium]
MEIPLCSASGSFILPSIEPHQAKSQALARTEIALKLLDIAKSRGVMFGAALDLLDPSRAAGGEGYLIEKTQNLRVANYLIDHGASYTLDAAGENATKSGPNISKLAFLLSEIGRVADDLDCEPEQIFNSRAKQIQEYFNAAFANHETLNSLFDGWGEDAVATVIKFDTPTEIGLRLLKFAKEHGYSFRDFHMETTDETLLDVSVSVEDIPDLAYIDFLLAEGVDPFHEVKILDQEQESELSFTDLTVAAKFFDFTQLDTGVFTASAEDEFFEAQEAFAEVFDNYENVGAEPQTAYEKAQYRYYSALANEDDLDVVRTWRQVLQSFDNVRPQ